MQKMLPPWTNNSRKVFNSFGEMQKSTVDFFKKNYVHTKSAKTVYSSLDSLSDFTFSTKAYLAAIKENLSFPSYTLFSNALLEYAEKKYLHVICYSQFILPYFQAQNLLIKMI
jgi:hypothetical protein